MTELQMGLIGPGRDRRGRRRGLQQVGAPEYRHRNWRRSCLAGRRRAAGRGGARAPVAGPAASDATCSGCGPQRRRRARTPPFLTEPILHHDRIEPVLRFDGTGGGKRRAGCPDVIGRNRRLACAACPIPIEPEHDPESTSSAVPASSA